MKNSREIYISSDSANQAYSGIVDDFFKYIEDFQLLSPQLWRRFVEQFRSDADADRGWRGEYWGKMMRGAALVYAYTKNPELYEILSKTVDDMIASAADSGRISAYPIEREFSGWDLWCRKYVCLGMQYFLEVCQDEVQKTRIVDSMRGQMDYIIAHIGKESGKTNINKATCNWRGLNSSSILEPVIRLYNLTGDQKYFDFATYIVEQGATDIINIFDLAYENELYPYQYPVTKAYEMTSCFEGLIEYYKITGIEKFKTAIINFANKILESDFTVIGCCGCTHELFDHSTVRQANTTNNPIMQETCVTVTLMKFFYRVYLLTGDTKYVDAFEISFFNAYLGAVNTEKVVEPTTLTDHPDWIAEPLPFDSYSPLTAGTRGRKIGGLQVMSDMHYYGCCACIGSAGIGIVPKLQLCESDGVIAMNLFINGTVKAFTPAGKPFDIITDTEYPRKGDVRISLKLTDRERFKLAFRIPSWSKNTVLKVNGACENANSGEYAIIDRQWSDGDLIELCLDMRTEAIYPISYGSQVLMNEIVWKADHMIPTFDREDPIAKNHIALRRGPLMLAQENRLGYSVDDPIDILVNEDGSVSTIAFDKKTPYPCIIALEVPTDKGNMLLTDYASAGKLWTDESKMAVWMLTK